jgi:hypothetical protein
MTTTNITKDNNRFFSFFHWRIVRTYVRTHILSHTHTRTHAHIYILVTQYKISIQKQPHQSVRDEGSKKMKGSQLTNCEKVD